MNEFYIALMNPPHGNATLVAGILLQMAALAKNIVKKYICENNVTGLLILVLYVTLRFYAVFEEWSGLWLLWCPTYVCGLDIVRLVGLWPPVKFFHAFSRSLLLMVHSHRTFFRQRELFSQALGHIDSTMGLMYTIFCDFRERERHPAMRMGRRQQ